MAKKVSGLFDGMWSMEEYGKDPKIDLVIQKALANPDDFVLKP